MLIIINTKYHIKNLNINKSSNKNLFLNLQLDLTHTDNTLGKR